MLAALGLTACGRNGPLEPPPGYEKDKEDEPFVLDPLIDPDGPKPSN
ncbi:MAG: lipoprotein [Rhizobiales bacterium]|nr:lipoprotein [Alphaproteobacteria bacterium]NNF78148.1 lipoprotein [Hyphomicrobiales bacterium]